MKKIYTWLFLCYLVAGVAHTAAAQQCGSVPYTDMIYRFSNWNWEVPPVLANNAVNPDYCKTWAMRRVNDGRSDALVINAPWVGASNGVLLRIANDQDYTRARGWELLRMNLGGVTAVVMPHFILYNKYTGTIRTFFYLDNSAGTYTNGAFVSMSHSTANGGNNSGVLALAKKTLLTPEKYLSSTDNDDEIITYVTKLTSQNGGWIVADFTAGYDPNSANSRYNSQALEFSVYGVTKNEIVLKGDFNFKTDKDDGLGFAGKKSVVVKDDPAKSVKTFLATGQKVLGVVDKVSSFADKFAAKSLKTSRNTKTVSPVASTTAADNASKAAAPGPSVFKTILNTAAGFNAAFGIIGSVVGLLWPDASAPAAAPVFTPTVSNGSITLSGTITTTYPLFSTSVRVPGTPHPSDPSTQTYYDCALGIFTIKNTPILNVGTWEAATDIKAYEDYYVPVYTRWNSYQVGNDLIATYNEAAGLSLLSVQAAIVVEQKRDIVYRDLYMKQQINSGEVIIVADDDSTVTYQTPFIKLGDFKYQSLTTASGEPDEDGYPDKRPSPAKIYIRIAAMLQRKNAVAGASPILYVQDYEPQLGGNSSSSVRVNPRYPSSVTPFEPIYSNLLSALAVNPSTPRSLYDDAANYDYTLPGAFDPYYVYGVGYVYGNSGRYNSPLNISASKSILFPGTQPATSTAVIDHPGNGTSYLLSNVGAALGPGFSITAGTNVVIATPLQAWKEVGNPAIIESNGPTQCAYNTNAFRTAAPVATSPTPPVATDPLAVYPNPTHGEFSVAINAPEGGVVTIYDALGRVVEKIAVDPLGSHTYKVNLAGRGVGFYVVRLETATTTTSKKLVVE
ncbi:MAG: T9SS type A sorting domain-containing protein [Janthinobacterium lividum]